MVTTQPSSNSSVPSVTPTVTPSPTQVTPSVTTPPHQKRPKRCELPELPFSHNMVDNMYIVGHILHAHDAVSEIHCEDFCLRAHNCLGFNFNVAGFSEKNCELLDHVKTYRSRPGFRFRLLDREYAYKVSVYDTISIHFFKKTISNILTKWFRTLSDKTRQVSGLMA